MNKVLVLKFALLGLFVGSTTLHSCPLAFQKSARGVIHAALPAKIKMISYNVEKTSGRERARFEALVKQLRAHTADVMVLQEVYDRETFQELVRSFGSGYEGIFFPGSHARNIHSAIIYRTWPGVLVREIVQGQRYTNGARSQDDFRDPRYVVFETTSSTGEVHALFAVVAVHLKSKRIRAHLPHPSVARAGQIEGMVQFLEKVIFPLTPLVMIAGDFNGDLRGINNRSDYYEFQALWNRGFAESNLLTSNTPAAEDLYTHRWIPRQPNSLPVVQLLDGILLSPSLKQSVIQTFIDPFIYLSDKERLSDHRLTGAVLDVRKDPYVLTP